MDNRQNSTREDGEGTLSHADHLGVGAAWWLLSPYLAYLESGESENVSLVNVPVYRYDYRKTGRADWAIGIARGSTNYQVISGAPIR